MSAKLKTGVYFLMLFSLLGHLKPTYEYILSCPQLNIVSFYSNELNHSKLGQDNTKRPNEDK